MREKLAAIGSLLITALLSTCCTLPLALASLGLGSLSLGSFIHPLRPYMIGVAAAFLTFGFFRVYTMPSTKKNRILMWVSAGVFLVVVATPYVVGYLREDSDLPVVDEPGTRRVTVHIDNLEILACCEGPAKETLAALPGVRRVSIRRRHREAVLVVRQDAEINDEMITRALSAVDHTGHIKMP